MRLNRLLLPLRWTLTLKVLQVLSRPRITLVLQCCFLIRKNLPQFARLHLADRRIHARYAFTAPAEVIAAEGSVRIETRVRDLSQQGCYVDTHSPLALGTAADIHITKGAKSFQAHARVVYNQPGKGMGLMFTAVESERLESLDTWIAESRETSWLAANRRRSQRVLMRSPCGFPLRQMPRRLLKNRLTL